MSDACIVPDWPVAAHVRSCSTLRYTGVTEGQLGKVPPLPGGGSQAPFNALNLGDHVGDNPQVVAQNRLWLQNALQLTQPMHYLQQVHGTQVVHIKPQYTHPIIADAVISTTPGLAAIIMTADCLPVLFCNTQGTKVAAAHAGWRGLLDGVLENTVSAMNEEPGSLLAWLGPAIGPAAFEVGAEVQTAFVQQASEAAAAFVPVNNKYLANIYQLARMRLQLMGITSIYGGNHCTYSEPELFFSYRRDGQTGRMASFIWLDDQ